MNHLLARTAARLDAIRMEHGMDPRLAGMDPAEVFDLLMQRGSDTGDHATDQRQSDAGQRAGDVGTQAGTGKSRQQPGC